MVNLKFRTFLTMLSIPALKVLAFHHPIGSSRNINAFFSFSKTNHIVPSRKTSPSFITNFSPHGDFNLQKEQCWPLCMTSKLRDDTTNESKQGDIEQDPSAESLPSLTKEERLEILKKKSWYIADENVCFYKRHDGMWKRRLNLTELRVGQRLFAYKMSKDFLDGKTGPKLFFECGVGRIDKHDRWQIVTGMLRIGRRGAKRTMIQKRLRRLSGKLVALYVTKIDTERGMLEVSETLEEAQAAQTEPKKTPASKLKIGQELVGKIVTVKPYGVFVDVGASRNGLLHIKTASKLFGKWLDPEDWWKEFGLEMVAKVRVSVMSNERKRLALGFTEDVKLDAEEEKAKVKEEKRIEQEKWVAAKNEKLLNESKMEDNEEDEETDQSNEVSEDDAAAWAEFAAADGYYDDMGAEYDDGDDGDVEPDEDRNIEDSLGIGSY